MTARVKRWSLMTPGERDAYADELNRVECTEQGLPQFVEDPVVLRRVARIITTSAGDKLLERAS